MTDKSAKSFDVIATVSSPYKERFGIPRQPGLVNACGKIFMNKGYDDPDMLDGLNEFSHIWVTFLFHANAEEGWNAKVRPPRLGSKQKVGVFASRSPYRPNFIGQSVLKLEAVHQDKPVHLEASGLDLLDETPIIDIKPYVAYADALPHAASGFASAPPEPLQAVAFSDEALGLLKGRPNAEADRQFIEAVLALDPRPAYHQGKEEGRRYGMRLADYEVKWEVQGDQTRVVALRLID